MGILPGTIDGQGDPGKKDKFRRNNVNSVSNVSLSICQLGNLRSAHKMDDTELKNVPKMMKMLNPQHGRSSEYDLTSDSPDRAIRIQSLGRASCSSGA